MEMSPLEILDHFVDLFNRLEVSLVIHSGDYLSEQSKARWDVMFNHCQKILRKLSKAMRWNDIVKPLEENYTEKKYDSFGRSIGEKKKKIEYSKLKRGAKLDHLLLMRTIAATRDKSISNQKEENSRVSKLKLSEKKNGKGTAEGCTQEYAEMLKEFQNKRYRSQTPKITSHRGTLKHKVMSQNISVKTSTIQVKEKPYLDDVWLCNNIRKAASIIGKLIMKDVILCFNNPFIIVNGEIDISKDATTRCPAYTIFKRMRCFETFQSALHMKFANFEEDLIQLIISPRDMFKFLDDTFDCVSETYPKKKLTLVKFREIVSQNRRFRAISKGNMDKIKSFKIDPKSNDKSMFKSSIHFCSFLLLQAIKGEMEQLSNYIKDLNVLIKNFAKLLYIFLPYHNKECFSDMVSQSRLKLIPRLSCLLVVQIFCKTFCDLASCWQVSGLQDSDRHRLLIFISDEKFEKSYDSSTLQSMRSSRKSEISYVEEMRRSSRSSKFAFSLQSIEKWLKDFLIYLVGMSPKESASYDFGLRKVDNKPIVKMKMSLWSVLLDVGDETGSFSITRDVFIAEGGHLSYDIEKAQQFIEEKNKSQLTKGEEQESPDMSQARPRKVLFSKHGSKISRNKTEVSRGSMAPSNEQNIQSNTQSIAQSTKLNPSYLQNSIFSTTNLAVNLIETLYNKDEYEESRGQNTNTIQVVLPRANISKIQSILASKGINALSSTFSKPESELQQAADDDSVFSADISGGVDEINLFFQTYWEPKLKDVANQTDTKIANEESLSAKTHLSSPTVVIRPTFGQIVLNLDPAIVAKCLVTFSLRDDENQALGRRLSYRSLLNPDLSIISKFTTVNEKTAEYLEKRRKTSIKVELLPNLDAMLTNKNVEDFQLKMTHQELAELKDLVKEELTRQLTDLHEEEDINLRQEVQRFKILTAEPESMMLPDAFNFERLLEEEEVLISSLNFHGPQILESLHESTSNLYSVISKATVPKFFVEDDNEMEVENEAEDEMEDLQDDCTDLMLMHPEFVPSGCGKGSRA